MRTLWIQTALIVALGALHAGEAGAQTYPDRPVRLVVPYAPGGGADIHARLVAAHLATALGQQVLVENRPGAGSNLGTEHVARSAPDGYTLLVSSTATAVNQSMYRKLPFNVLKDFDSVSVLATVPLVVAVHPSVPAQTIPELVALAKSKPGVLNYASGGVGTANHLGGELFKLLAGVDIAHVAYKGGGPAINDLLAGHVQLLFGTVSSTYPLVKAGRLKGLATTGPKRSSAAPDLPTVIEAGLPGYEVTAWYGVLAPTGTPRPILERLAREIDRIVQLPDIQTAFQKQGSEAVGGTTEVASRFLHREVETWEKVVKASNMTAE
jgi:tripartite-type tricarboxylate transporter receptor subunit TctC